MGAISRSIKALAEKLQNDSDTVLEAAEAQPELFKAVATSVADAIVGLEKAAEIIERNEPQFSSEDLEGIVQLANTLDSQDDEDLRKQASVLDEILLTIGAPKNAIAEGKARTEDEINRLREKYRTEHREKLYHNKTSTEFENQWRREDVQKAVKEQVKEFRTMQSPLSSRYCPDHPGVGVSRIADRVYQCSLDKKIYNYETGFKTNKGNTIPGGGVDMQSPDWGNRDQGHMTFDTRESLMSRFAECFDENGILKTAALNGLLEELKEEQIKTAQEMDGIQYQVSSKRDVDPVTSEASNTLMVRVPTNTPNEIRQKIMDELVGTYGPMYSIIFEDA